MSTIVDGVRRPRIELWTNAQAAGGTLLHRITEWGENSEVERSLRGDSRLRLAAPMTAEWTEDVAIDRVIRIQDDVLGADPGETFPPVAIEEWRVHAFRRVDGAARAVMPIEALPIINDLARTGPVYEKVAGAPVYALGEMTLTWQEAWDDLIDPFLTDLGITWWDRIGGGGGPVTVNVTNLTPLALLRAINAGQSVSYQNVAQHDGATRIKIFNAPQGFDLGISSATRRLNVQRDDVRVTELADQQRSDRLVSVAVATRAPLAGGTDTVGLYGLVVEVTNVAGSVLTVSSPEGGLPLVLDDQWGGASAVYPNHYLLKADGTLTEIEDSTRSPRTVTVADATGVSVGDLVEIRRNSAGDAPVEAVNPALLPGRYPIVHEGGVPEGRNYTLNPLWRDWPAAAYGAAHPALVDGTYTSNSSTLPLRGLPAGLSIPDGTLVLSSAGDHVTTADGAQSADGSGDVSLTVVGTVNNSNMSDGTQITLLVPPGLADGWALHYDGADDVEGPYTPAWAKRDATEDTTTLTSAAIRATTSLGSGNLWSLPLKGLSAGRVLQPGDVIVATATPTRYATVVGRAVADGSGDADVPIWTTAGVTWTLDDALTIYRPAYGALGDDALVTWQQALPNATDSHGLASGAVVVREIEGWSLRATARIAVFNATNGDVTVTPSSSVKGIRVALLDASDGSVIDSTQDAERTYSSREVTVVTLTVDHTPTATGSYQVLVEPSGTTSGAAIVPNLVIVPLEVSLSYGPVAYTMTGIEYSGTNSVYAELARQLQNAQSARQLEVRVRDIAYSATEVPDTRLAEEKITLGAPWLLRSEVLGLDARPGNAVGIADGVVRVVRYTHDLHDLTKATVVLGHDLYRLSQEGS